VRVCIWMFDLNFYFVWDQEQNALKISGGWKNGRSGRSLWGFECKWSRSGHWSVMIFMIPKTRTERLWIHAVFIFNQQICNTKRRGKKKKEKQERITSDLLKRKIFMVLKSDKNNGVFYLLIGLTWIALKIVTLQSPSSTRNQVKIKTMYFLF
jgi:hypothetical protein